MGRTGRCSPLPSTLSSMEEISTMTLLSSLLLKTLSLTVTLTQLVCLLLMNHLKDQHVLPQDGARTSLELLASTRWSSRKLISQLTALASVRTVLEPPDWDKSSSCMTHSCVLVV